MADAPLAAFASPAFAVSRWLASAHLQSLGAALPLWAPPRSLRVARREPLRIPLPSGGALRGHAWWQPGRAPAVVIVHGVGGSSASRYVVRAAASLYRAGWHAVRLDLRGAGDSIPDAPALYHAGLTEDPRVAIAYLAARAEVDGVAAVGFSLGGHVLLRLAGEDGDGPGATADRERGPLRAVVAISAPVDLSTLVRSFERLRSRPYHVYVLRSLVRQAKRFARAHPDRVRYDARALGRLRTIRAYDAAVIAPMHGFASAEDYYVRASAAPMLGRIRVPTLFVHAEDDPIVPVETVRPWLAQAPAALEQAWTAHGGHVGWFAGIDESSWVDTWAMTRAREFLAFMRA
jgi:uncharacterized protein